MQPSDLAGQEIAARIDRLPPCHVIRRLVVRIAVGNWFEAYELFMPAFISIGLIKVGFTPAPQRAFWIFAASQASSPPALPARSKARCCSANCPTNWLGDRSSSGRCTSTLYSIC